MKYTDSFLKKKWNEFGDIPINEDEETDEGFFLWEKGTDRYVIWEWFDNNYSNGLEGLMNLSGNTEIRRANK